MKKIFISIIFVLLANILFSQNQEWLTYELDSTISFEMPSDAYELDTISQGMRMYQIYSHSENSTFIAQKALVETENQNEDLSRLPSDLKSLKEQYNGIIAGISKSIPYKLESKELIEKENFLGYRLKFSDSLNNPTYEVEFFLLNKHLYSFFYVDLENFSKSKKDLFFSSIIINTDQRISQFLGKPQSYRIGYLFGRIFLSIMILTAILYFVIKKMRK